MFAVHGIGGIVGNLLTGIFAQKAVAAVDGTKIAGGWLDGHWEQLWHQLVDTLAGAAWAFVVTIIIVYILDKIPGLSLRVSPEVEDSGIDEAELGEPMYLFVDELERRQAELDLKLAKYGGQEVNGSSLKPLVSLTQIEMTSIKGPANNTQM